MFLKSLEVQGFKSFADKTKLDFTKGLTAVVGPNGSGKSNISDAVRWVLGEQSTKTLRGNKMEDVIFGGTPTRNAMGFCEVSLIIDNSDNALDIESDKVTITRRLNRSGDSDYKINNTNVRLKDIHELLMDTGLGKDGYAIIGQGKIAEIVGAKSNDRREIFEEAAGISKFKYKRLETQKRLLLAEDNLSRLRDIINELEQRIEPLKKQSEKAKIFVELSGEKKTVEISVFVKMIEMLKHKLRDFDTKIIVSQTDYNTVEQEIEKLEQILDQTFSNITQINIKKDQTREDIKQNTDNLSKLQEEIAVFKNDMLHNNNTIERMKSELGQSDEARETFLKNIADKEDVVARKQDEISSKTLEKTEFEKALESLNAKRDKQDLKLIDMTKEKNELTLKLSVARSNILSISESLEDLKYDYDRRGENYSAKNAQLESLKKELLECEGFKKDIEHRLNENNNAYQGYKLKRKNKEDKILETDKLIREKEKTINENQHKVKILTELENNMEGYAYSVKSILKAFKKGELFGVHGTVSDIIEVEARLSLAIETAIGAAVQNIVVDNEKAAKDGISYLKQNKAGRATFLPLTSVKGKTIDDKNLSGFEGFIGVANKLVKYDSRYQNIISSILGRVLISQNIDTASDMAKKLGYSYKIVTLDGQVINAGGSFTGGSNAKSTGVFSRKQEIEKLKLSSNNLNLELEQLQQQYQSMLEESNKLYAHIKIFENEQKTLNEDDIKNDYEIKRITMSIDEAEKLIGSFDDDNKKISNKINDLEQKLTEIKQEKEAMKTLLLEKDHSINTIGDRTDGLENQRKELAEKIFNRTQDVAFAQKDVENLREQIADIKARLNDHQQNIAQKSTEIEQLEKLNNQIISKMKSNEDGKIEITQKIENLSKSIESLNAQALEIERSSREVRDETERERVKKEAAFRELTKLQNQKDNVQKEYDRIISQLWDEYELALSQALDIAQPIEDIELYKRKLFEIKSRIKSLGSVNVDSIAEYSEVMERYSHMKKQCDDATKSREELLQMIDELTQKMQEMFLEKFNSINRYFGKIFTELFGGGRAEFKLTDETNLLETGIEILVEPPGKTIKNLSLLSGGEQAFIAIAIYFAILRVSPSPFCILDEIEAALDDVNVFKYASYLRKMNDNTQFIMITHRRGTMEEADVLYGVTMQNEGVSKLIELNVNEVESKLGIK